MKCPYCHANQDVIVDSRLREHGCLVSRRRKCFACGRRFTTHERIEEAPGGRRDGDEAPTVDAVDPHGDHSGTPSTRDKLHFGNALSNV